MSDYQAEKALVLAYYEALQGASVEQTRVALDEYTAPDWQWYGVHPFGEQRGSEAVMGAFWSPYLQAFNNVQRRMDVFMAGSSEIDGTSWVCSMGHLMGLFDADWLGIHASGKMTFLRYADFNCIKDGKIVRSGFFCDIIGVMHQVGISPLPPQTGASFIYPGPRTHDGILTEVSDPGDSRNTLDLVNHMIADLNELNLSGEGRYPPEILARTWHEDMAWYGPAGIGASYTIRRYQEQHSFPFRENLKDKVYNGHICRFAEGNYAGFFGWPNLTNTPTGGFLGLPGNNVKADMRVVDIYRREGDKLAENWVIIDLPHWLLQQGLDILDRTSQIVGRR